MDLKERLEQIKRALQSTCNDLALKLDKMTYKFLKFMKDTELGKGLIRDIALCLLS